jgi:hypothetical protein
MPRVSARRELDGRSVESWRCHEDAEPEILTGGLMEMVRATPAPMSATRTPVGMLKREQRR